MCQWGKEKVREMAAAVFLDGKKISAGGKAATAGQLLSLLKISAQEALVRVDGSVRPESYPLSGAKKVEVIRVVYGG